MELLEVERDSTPFVRLAIKAHSRVDVDSAELVFDHHELTVPLHKDLNRDRPGFYAVVDRELPDTVAVGLLQSDWDSRLDNHIHMSMAIRNADDLTPFYRGWVEYRQAGAPLSEIHLAGSAARNEILAYPNIVNWDEVSTDVVSLRMRWPRDHRFQSQTWRESDPQPSGVGSHYVRSRYRMSVGLEFCCRQR